MGWGQWRTRSVSLTKVSHSPDHDPHTYHTHTRTRTCPSRRVASSVSSSRTYSYTILHELDLSLNTFSSSYLFLFLVPFIILIILSLIFLIHRLLPNPTILHPLFPSSPIYTDPTLTHNLSLTSLLTLYSSSSFILPIRLLSLLFVLTSTNNVFRGSYGVLPLWHQNTTLAFTRQNSTFSDMCFIQMKVIEFLTYQIKN